MCGICGIWGEGSEAAITAMTAAMRHRGPDDFGMYRDERISLGMTRLAVIDPTPAGAQPMANPEGTVWIVFNGEMYNFREERAKLQDQGCHFLSASDAEVVLRLYERLGDDFLLRLRGMFALAVYDKRPGPGSERLLLARDPLGIKPLLYTENGGRFAFASELKALLAGGLVAREIAPEALRQLLTHGSIYQPLTILRDARMLMPAHRLIIEAKGRRCERYWSPAADRRLELRVLPYPEQVRILGRELEETVRAQMVSDVPLGVFLSGGVDSSLLAALMAREAGNRLKTFSVGFETEGAAIDESGEAAAVACFLGSDHRHVLVRGGEVRRCIHDVAAALDQPSVDGVNSYFVFRAARPDLTVAISGTGGDELFAGYPWFRSMMSREAEEGSPLERALAALVRQPVFDGLLNTRLQGVVAHARGRSGFLSRYALLYRIFGSAGAASLIARGLRHKARAGRAEHHDLWPGDDLNRASVISRVTALCLSGYTRNQLLRDTDAVSMAHSLEVRVPFLDTGIVDLALSLPDESKQDPAPPPGPAGSYRASGAKRILLDVARPLLPPDFDQRSKRGFSMPFASWLQGPLRESLDDALSDTSIAARGWFDSGAVAAVRARFAAGKSDWAQPWLLMMTELWARQVLDRRAGA